MTLRARACGLSDVGVIRSHNEDCFELAPEHSVFVVADGVITSYSIHYTKLYENLWEM